MRVKHNSTGFHLVEEAVEKFFSASWLSKWNPWCILSCWSSVDERDERGKVAYRRGMPKGGSIVQVQKIRCKRGQIQALR